MDWLRRNWPDLAIGLALVAVIGGIIATLITGGTFFPSTPAPAPAPAPTAPAVVPPASDPVVVPDEPTADTPPASPGSVSVLAPDGSDVPTEPAPVAPLEPAAPEAPPEPAASGSSSEPSTAAAPAPEAEPAPGTSSAAAPSAPAPTPAAPLPAASSDEEAPYRVSVGAFGNPDNAARQAQTVRDAGYPVFTGTQGNLTIVLVGPYDSEAEAERVSARIAAGGLGIEPIVYRFRPDATTPGASTPAPDGASTPAPDDASAPIPAPPTPTPTPAATPATPIATSPTGRSLQVGAFADAGSAVPLRERLAALGLVVYEIREDGLIKLLVGPFDADRLADVRGQLSAQGIESFPR